MTGYIAIQARAKLHTLFRPVMTKSIPCPAAHPRTGHIREYPRISTHEADLATERERHLTTGKRSERTQLDFRYVTNLPLCHWSSQLFDLRAPSSTDVPVLLLNHPIIYVGAAFTLELLYSWIGGSVIRVDAYKAWFSLAKESESKRSRKSAYNSVKIKNWSCKQSHRRHGFGVGRIKTLPFFSDSAYDSVAYDLVKTLLSESEAEAEG